MAINWLYQLKQRILADQLCLYNLSLVLKLSMSGYQRVMQAFQRAGYSEQSLVSENQLFTALDFLAREQGQFSQYDRNVATELLDETPKSAGGKVEVRNYVETILKGESIVRNQIGNLEYEIERISNPTQKNEKLKDLQSYTEDLFFLTVPFGLAAPRESKLLATMKPDSRRSSDSNRTNIFSINPIQKGRGHSTDLKIGFIVALMGFFLQLLLMSSKHHFFNLLVYLFVFCVFILNYFDAKFIKFLLISIAVSLVLDIAWLATHTNEYFNPHPETQYSTLHSGFLKFIIFFVIGLMLLKIIIAAILFKYRNNPSSIRKKCTLFGMQFPLDGIPDSLLAKLMDRESDYVGNETSY